MKHITVVICEINTSSVLMPMLSAAPIDVSILNIKSIYTQAKAAFLHILIAQKVMLAYLLKYFIIYALKKLFVCPRFLDS